MNKCHQNINWVNDTTPAINDTNLNYMDGCIDTIDDRVITLDGTKAAQSDMLLAFKDVSLNSTTGVITFTLFNNTTKTIDTLLEKVAINFDYDDDPTSPHYQNLIIELEDGTYKYIDMSALITEYEFTDSSTIDFTVTSGAVSASVIDGSITATKCDPTFALAISDAESNGLKSEGYAVGTQNGVPVSSGSPYYENNAKYWKEQAAAIAGQTLGGLTDVSISSPTDGQVLVYDSNSSEWVNGTNDASNKAAKTDLSSIIATGVTNTTGAQIPNGAYFYLNGVFCRAIADIAANATFTKNTNYKETTAGDSFNIRSFNLDLNGLAVTMNDAGGYFGVQDINSQVPANAYPFAVVLKEKYTGGVSFSIRLDDNAHWYIVAHAAQSFTFGNQRTVYVLYMCQNYL